MTGGKLRLTMKITYLRWKVLCQPGGRPTVEQQEKMYKLLEKKLGESPNKGLERWCGA